MQIFPDHHGTCWSFEKHQIADFDFKAISSPKGGILDDWAGRGLTTPKNLPRELKIRLNAYLGFIILVCSIRQPNPAIGWDLQLVVG